jgi:cysteine-rich repeat protein
LSAKTRPSKCGDTLIDPGESCDDGNEISGDGCSSACTMEIGESEDNGTPELANPLKPVMVGEITPGDVDVVWFVVANSGTTVKATTHLIPGKACRKNFIDSYLELLDSSGNVLAKDDDSKGVTAQVSHDYLTPGKYYLRLKAAPGAPPNHAFGYQWYVKLGP